MARMLWLCHKIEMRSLLKEESLGEARCRKSWIQLQGYDSPSLRYAKQVPGKRKDHRLDKCKSNILISEIHTL